MHDRKARPDVCKMCDREARMGRVDGNTGQTVRIPKQEQEATIMAKQTVECVTCGGSYDGTPSGQKKHEATNRHQEGGYRPSEPVAPTVLEVAKATVAEINSETRSDDEIVIADLSNLIGDKEQELARRQVDHKWRVANRPEQAQDYFASKVQPLLSEIDLLRVIRTSLKLALQK